MKIGIISDTHDHLIGLRKAIKILKEYQVEMIIHCGDWVSPFTLEFFDKEMEDFNIPVKSVVGNNPGDIKRVMMNNPKMKNPIEWCKTTTLELDIDGKKAILYHGDNKSLLQRIIDSQKYDLVFTGHTHAPRNETIGKTLIVCPGNTCYARGGDISKDASVAIYDSKTNKAEIIQLK